MIEVNHECYVDLEVAELLREAGFNWECHASYQNGVFTEFQCSSYFKVLIMDFNNAPDYMNQYSAPTLDVAQRWLREVKGIHITVKPNEASANCKYFVTVIVNDTKWGNIQDDNRKTIMFDTYEEVQEAGIKKALELILEKRK